MNVESALIFLFIIGKVNHLEVLIPYYKTVHLSWLLENQLKCIQKLLITLHKKCSYSKVFWSAFFHIRTEYLFENPLTCKLPKRSSVTEVAQVLFSTFMMPVNECFWFTMHLNCRIYCVETIFHRDKT